MTVGASSWKDAFGPITFEIGFLESPLDVVCSAFLDWERQHSSQVIHDQIRGEIAEGFSRLPPLSSPPRRVLFWQTRSPWVAYFDNGIDGPDPVGPISYLSEELRSRGAVVIHVPHSMERETGTAPGTYGSTQFQLFSPRQTDFLNFQRTVSATFDGGRWRFDANGEVQPYEELEQYQKRRISDRLTLPMLERYCRALGIDLASEEFYGDHGCLISVMDPLGPEIAELSLSEARKRLGLSPL